MVQTEGIVEFNNTVMLRFRL